MPLPPLTPILPSSSTRSHSNRFAALALVLACTTALHAIGAPTDKLRLRVAGAQIPVTRDIAANVAALTRAIDFAAREKADVLVTPEGSLSGYFPEFDAHATQRALSAVLDRARAANIALVLGTCFEGDDGRRYNAQRFYTASGDYLGFHAKILLCRRMSDPLGKGEVDSFQTRPLRTFALSGLTVGGLICNDMWANPEYTPMDDPHLAQKLMELGARVIFVSANTGRSVDDQLALSRAFHDSNIRLRTRAGKLWTVVINAADPEATPGKGLHAPSGVVAPDGTWQLMVAEPTERLFVYTIELEPRASLAANL